LQFNIQICIKRSHFTWHSVNKNRGRDFVVEEIMHFNAKNVKTSEL